MSLLKHQIKSYCKLSATVAIQYEHHHVPIAKILSYDDNFILIEYKIKNVSYICSTRIDLIVGIILLEDEHRKMKKIDGNKQYE